MTHRNHTGKPKTADITTLAVLVAVDRYHRSLKGTLPGLPGVPFKRPVKALTEATGCHEKVAMRAIEREIDRNYIEWGVNPFIGWLTPEGLARLEELKAVN